LCSDRAMTYGLEWTSRPSTNQQQSKNLNKFPLLDLPVEVLAMILSKMGYQELRNMEMSSSFFRLLIVEFRMYSRLYHSLPYYNRQTLTCLHWLESSGALSATDISRLCKRKLHQYYHQDCCDLMCVMIKLLHSGILKRKLDEIW